jgi:hypothetical protein
VTAVDERTVADDPAAQERARFRAFVRRHHPDVGGDPETFRRGVAAAEVGASPFAAVGEPEPDAATLAWWASVAEDDPRLDAPVVAVSGHVVPRTLRAGRRWLGRAPLNPVRTRRVV